VLARRLDVESIKAAATPPAVALPVPDRSDDGVRAGAHDRFHSSPVAKLTSAKAT
jgi:hypothetical protein